MKRPSAQHRIIEHSDPFWVYLRIPNADKVLKNTYGKWVHHDDPPRLEQIADELMPLIADGLTPMIKYRPTLNDPQGPYAHLLPPMCVYVTPEHQQAVHDRLTSIGLTDIYWQSEEATRRFRTVILATPQTKKAYVTYIRRQIKIHSQMQDHADNH